MAELLQQDVDDKEKSSKRRKFLRGNFLSSWLRLQRQPTNDEANKGKNEDIKDNDETTEKKLSFSERLFRKLSRVFRNLIFLEPVAETVPAHKALEMTRKEQNVLGKTGPENSFEDDKTDYVNVPLGSHDRGKEIDTPPNSEDDINGAIDKDFYEDEEEKEEPYEPVEQSVPPPEEIVLQTTEIKTNVNPATGESSNSYDKGAESVGFSTTGSSAVSAGEVLRRRQEKKLKKEVIKLKEYVQDLETEQKAVELQQEDFSRQLIKRQFRERPDNVLAPKPEQSSQQPGPRREVKPQNLSNEQAKPRIDTKKPLEIKETPLFTEKFKELIATPTETQPEIILQAVEQAAEQNAPIESIYEHRHEIKDRRDRKNEDYVITKGNGRSMAAKRQTNNRPLTKRPANGLYTERPKEDSRPLNNEITSRNDDMYKQAVRGGFWTAIMLIVLVGLLIIITR